MERSSAQEEPILDNEVLDKGIQQFAYTREGLDGEPLKQHKLIFQMRKAFEDKNVL